MQRDTAASHPFFIDMLLTEIFFKGITLPNAPVTRSHRIMKPTPVVPEKPKKVRSARSKSGEMSVMEQKVLKTLTYEFQPSLDISTKVGIPLNHFYQVIAKLSRKDLVEAKRVNGPGTIRYRHYRKIHK